MAVTASARLGINRWSAESDPFNRTQQDADHAILDNLVAIDVQDLLANRPAPGIRGRFFTESSASAGLPGTTWREDGTAWRSVGSRVVGAASGEVSQIIRGATGQSTDIWQVQNSAGGWLGGWSSAGLLTANVGAVVTNAGNGAINPLIVNNGGGNTNTVVEIIRGTSGQGTDLTQWQASGGTVLSRVDQAGNHITQGGAGFFANLASIGAATTSAHHVLGGYAAGKPTLMVKNAGGQGDDIAQFINSIGNTARKVRNNDVPVTNNYVAGVTTDWSWPVYVDGADDTHWTLQDAWGKYVARLLTNASGPYADPLAIYLPFNLAGSYASPDRNSWRNGRVVGRFTYIRNDGSATYEGVLVRVGSQANTLNAIYNNGLFSLQPSQYDRLHVWVDAGGAS